MLRIGDKEITAAYLGGRKIARAYLGEDVVFDTAEPPVPAYTVTTAIDPTGGGTATGAGTYQQGASVTVTATPADGYKFVGWKSGGTTVSTSVSYTFTVTGDVSLTAVFEVEKTSRLPAGYTEVEYIYTTDGTLIQTNFTPSTGATRIVSKWMPTKINSNSTNDANAILGGNMSSGQYYLRFSSTTKIERRFQSATGGSSSYTIPSVLNREVEITVDYPAKKFYVDGESFSMGTVNSPTGTLNLFNNYNLARRGLVGRCYYCKIYNKSTLYTELVPCINPSGQAGLYDVAKNAFYTAKKPELLAAGPAV